jgi:CHAT domain-containing protein
LDFENLDQWQGDKDILRAALDLLFDLYVSQGDIEDYDKSIKVFNKLISYFNNRPVSDFDYGKNEPCREYIPADIYKDFYMTSLISTLSKAYTESGYYLNGISLNQKGLEINLNIQKKLESHKNEKGEELKRLAVELEANFKNNIGIDFLRSGNLTEAEIYVNEALKIVLKQSNSENVVKWKANLAAVYTRQKKYAPALKGFEETLPQLKKLRDEYALKFKVSKDISDRLEERNLAAFVGISLYYYGTILRETGKLPQAVQFHEESAKSLSESRFRKFEARARVELGLDYLAFKNTELAEKEFTKAYRLSKSIKARDEEIVALDGLMRVWQNKNESQAIIYGKQSVNLLQIARFELQQLGENYASEFIKDNENTYRLLTNLLIKEERIPEALLVLDLLKREEYKSFATRGDDAVYIPYSDAEKEITQALERFAEISRELAELERAKEINGRWSEEQIKRSEELNKQIDVVRAAFSAEIKKLAEISKNDVEAGTAIGNLTQQQKIQEKLTTFNNNKKLDGKTAVIYTVFANKSEVNEYSFGWVVLVLADGRKIYPIDTKDLSLNITAFLSLLKTPNNKPEEVAQTLYNKIFRQKSEHNKKTLEEDLETYFKGDANKRIMWSLDGMLRYVPMAALHDGQNYLVDKYIQSLITPESIGDLDKDKFLRKEILGLGVSEAKEIDGYKFDSLPGVIPELSEIIHQPNEKKGIFDGARKINSEFTKDSLNLLRSGNYSMAHIATHYKYNPVSAKDSFFVTGDGKITFEDLKSKGDRIFGSLEILTTSACETGVSGTGKESEGFSVLGQRLGAKTVIASLWKISDNGTPELMIQFYKKLKDNSNLTKGEAFRQAQLSLLNGEVNTSLNTSGNNETTSSSKNNEVKTTRSDLENETGIKINPYKTDPAKPFAHPHYWASFVIVGNWL